MEGVAETVRAAIEAQGLSFSQVAETIGIGRQTLSRKINGHVDFSLSEMGALGELLGVPAWELMRRAEAELERALADGAHTPPAPRSQTTNPAATVVAGPHTEVES